MAREKREQEAGRWMRAARDDMKTTEVLEQAGQFSHSCFHAHQAAEKACKAMLYYHDFDPWGRSVANLLRKSNEQGIVAAAEKDALQPSALLLDRFYVPTRYQNGLPDISPDEAYCAEDARMAISYAR